MSNAPLFLAAKEVLISTTNIIKSLTVDEYTTKISLLDNSSIGQHSRHIIELFQQLLNGYELAEVDYDNRARNLAIQENMEVAVACMAKTMIEVERPNKPLQLKSMVAGANTHIESNYYRELLFTVEHCIHHQAIIKIGLSHLQKEVKDKSFGVAPSTLKYRKKGAG